MKNYIKGYIKNDKLVDKIHNIVMKNSLPFTKVIGKRYFWKYLFRTNHHTLDPRPETEQIIEIIKEDFALDSSFSCIELGVGTGALIISIAKEFQNWTCMGTDISHQALRAARYNQRKIGVKNLTLLYYNWLKEWETPMDILISNPPYISIAEYNSNTMHDPKVSLLEPEDLYFYKLISQKKHLFKYIIVEISAYTNILTIESLFPGCIIYNDLASLPRILKWTRKNTSS